MATTCERTVVFPHTDDECTLSDGFMNTYVYVSDNLIFTLDAAFWLGMGVIEHGIRNGIQHPLPPLGPTSAAVAQGGAGGPFRPGSSAWYTKWYPKWYLKL